MKVRLTRTVKLDKSILKKTIDLLLPFIGTMNFIEEKKPLLFQTNNFKWDDFFTSCTEYRKTNNFEDDDFLVVLTELKNEPNWFSAFSFHGERTVFIHATEWENYIYCEPYYPVAYEVVANVLQSVAFNKHGEGSLTFVHQEPIGCINDMCSWKIDISFKLRTADICSTCLKMFSEIVTKEHIQQAINIFEGLRKKMLFNTNFQKPLSFEESLPFSVAITKRKLSTTLEPFRKLLMLIDHFDSIVRTAVIMFSHISKSQEEVAIFLGENNLAERPSLGNWVNALALLSNQTLNTDWGFHLPNDFAEKVKQVILLTNDNKITLIRNEQRGHGYINCNDNGYKQTFQECLPAIEEMEKLLSPLFYRFKYYQILNTTRLSGNKFAIRAYNLSGSNPAFLEEEVMTSFRNVEDIPIENHFYLVTPNKTKWFDLHPYFKYGECNLCHHNRLLVFDGIYLLDPYIGHRFKTSNL